MVLTAVSINSCHIPAASRDRTVWEFLGHLCPMMCSPEDVSGLAAVMRYWVLRLA